MDGATGTPRSATSTARPAEAAARRRPGAGEVFRAQLMLLSRRWPGLLGVAAALAGVVPLTAAGWTGWVVPSVDVLPAGPPLTDALAEAWSLYSLVAFFWAPMLAWKEEGPSDRAYHWTLPVDRPTHQLLRLGAGWVLLVGVLAAGIAGGWIVGAAAQDGMALGDPAVLAAALPSATVLYLTAGSVALVTDRPVLWIVVGYVAAGTVAGLGALGGWGWLADPVREALFTGPLSLTAAVTVPSTVAASPGPGDLGATPWQAAGLWLVVVAAVTVAAARLHLERSGEG